MIYSYLDMNRVYYNAFINRCYINFNKTEEYYQQCRIYFDKLKQIWTDRDIVILESKDVPLGVTNDILDTAKSISRIIFCPVRNAFNKYSQILSSFDKINKDVLILAALGPSATVLAYDLHKKGYQAIDIGDINAEYECFLYRKMPLELKEKGHECVIKREFSPDDTDYRRQIIHRID
jgi:glycosyltransferase family protein